MLKQRIVRTLFAMAALAASLATLSVAPAMAEREGEYKVFEHCPLTVKGVKGCLVARTESGEIDIGKLSVPIVSTQTLQGGFSENRETGALTFIAAANGETFSKTPQKVAGGLFGIKCEEVKGHGRLERGIRGACEYLFEHGLAEVRATTELATTASSIGLNENNLLLESGTALSLPVKVKLDNPLLGSDCYIGSESEPITLNLTSGTSGSLKGRVGLPSTRGEGGILVVSFNTLVDSGFSAPKATGCGIFGLLDGIIDKQIGLPASSADLATLNDTLEQASAALVRVVYEEEEQEA